MAVINKNNSKMEFPLQIKRQYAGPIEANEIFYNLEEAKTYAKSGATAYAGQTIKVIDEAKKTITVYTIQIDGNLKAGGNAEHTHAPSEIIETADKKFVSDAEKNRWNDKYTKQETDDKLKAAISGLTFKGTFNTLADLPSQNEAKDGWFAIVVNDPAGKGKNLLVIYESTDKQWKQLGDLLVPGVATDNTDGLMGKEMVKALNKAGVDIAGLKDGSLLPKASATQIGAVKIGANIQVSADGTISTHAPYQHPENHPATIITEDTAHRFVSDADKAVYADKYTKKETDAKFTEVEGKITTAYKAEIKKVDDKVVAMDTAYKVEDNKIRTAFANADTALENKLSEAYKAADTALTQNLNSAKEELSNQIKAVDAKFVAATEQQIDALFAE